MSLHVSPPTAAIAPRHGAPPAPAPEVATLADRVRDAGERGTPLRIAGAGGWLDAARPVRHGHREVERIDVGALPGMTGILEYVPGDLTLTARAGTSLSEIASATAAHGQWLALDPHGTDAGTLGATIATASAGPLATAFGTPRDAVLGVEFVTGTGAVVRGGGRVVKNVAGFDLVRLVTGAWGTLGILTEVTVRLRARPAVDETLALPLPRGGDAVRDVAAALRALPFVPLAAELLSASLARSLEVGDGEVLLVRLGGSEAAVSAQRAAIGAIGATIGGTAAHDATAGAPADVWARLRASDRDCGVVTRVSAPPSRIADSWRAAAELMRVLPGARAHASVLRGIVRCMAPVPDAPAPALAAAIAEHTRPALELRVVHERLPAALWPALAPSAVDDRLSHGLRDAFDPRRILNPGILGE